MFYHYTICKYFRPSKLFVLQLARIPVLSADHGSKRNTCTPKIFYCVHINLHVYGFFNISRIH